MSQQYKFLTDEVKAIWFHKKNTPVVALKETIRLMEEIDELIPVEQRRVLLVRKRYL